jgi:NADH-ubiquinone oxidoreductase chain 4
VGLFSFYLFFESSLIPTVFIILGWAYQPERLQAGIYLLFHTLLASLPLLVGVFFCIFSSLCSVSFLLLCGVEGFNGFFLFLYDFGINFADKRWSLGWNSSLAD